MILVILFIIISIHSYGQILETQLQVKKEVKEEKWLLYVKSNLPRFTRITGVVYFQNKQLPGARYYTRVKKNGNFILKYSTNRKFPSGQYKWKIVSRTKEKTKNFSYDFDFFYGTHYKQQLEIKQETIFYTKILKDIQNFSISVNRQGKDFLAKKSQNKTIIKKWVLKTGKQFKNIEKKCYKHFTIYAFPYFSYSYKSLKSIIHQLEKIVYSRIYEVLSNFSIPIPKRFYIKNTISGKNIEKKIKLIKTLSNKIKQSLPLSSNVSHQDLKKDIMWFNLIFARLANYYNKAQNNFNKNNWEKNSNTILKELQAFSIRTEIYKQSSLIGKHRKINDCLNKLVNYGQKLVKTYTVKLYKKYGFAIPIELKRQYLKPQQIIKQLRQNINKLLAFIEDKKQNKKNLKRKNYEKAQHTLKELQKEYEELQKAVLIKKAQNYLKFDIEWRNKRSLLLEQIKDWQASFPDLSKLFEYAIFLMDNRVKIHKYYLNGKFRNDEAKVKLYLKELNWKLKLLLQRIVKESKKGL